MFFEIFILKNMKNIFWNDCFEKYFYIQKYILQQSIRNKKKNIFYLQIYHEILVSNFFLYLGTIILKYKKKNRLCVSKGIFVFRDNFRNIHFGISFYSGMNFQVFRERILKTFRWCSECKKTIECRKKHPGVSMKKPSFDVGF